MEKLDGIVILMSCCVLCTCEILNSVVAVMGKKLTFAPYGNIQYLGKCTLHTLQVCRICTFQFQIYLALLALNWIFWYEVLDFLTMWF